MNGFVCNHLTKADETHIHSIFPYSFFKTVNIDCFPASSFLFTNPSDFCLTSASVVSVEEKDNFSFCTVSKPTRFPCKV